MHDLAAAGDIVEAAMQVAADNGGGTVRRVHVRLGAKSHLDPQILREAFEIVASGTVATGAELRVEKPPAHCRCRVCGRTFESTEWPTLCECGSFEIFSEDSSCLTITAIDVEEATPDAQIMVG